MSLFLNLTFRAVLLPCLALSKDDHVSIPCGDLGLVETAGGLAAPGSAITAGAGLPASTGSRGGPAHRQHLVLRSVTNHPEHPWHPSLSPSLTSLLLTSLSGPLTTSLLTLLTPLTSSFHRALRSFLEMGNSRSTLQLQQEEIEEITAETGFTKQQVRGVRRDSEGRSSD